MDSTRGERAPTLTPAPWYFRYRIAVYTAAYFGGFFLGYFVTGLFAHDGRAFEPTFAQLGTLAPAFGTRGSLGLALLFTFAGWFWRAWGASYLSQSVVWAPSVETRALHVAGPYRFTRNPLYFGNLWLALGVGMLGPPAATVLVFLLNCLTNAVLIRAEEPSLRAVFGAAYDDYARRVPRLIPVFFRSAPPSNERPSLAEGLLSEAWSLSFVGAMLVCYLMQRGFFPAFWFAWIASAAAGVARSALARRSQI